MKITRRRAVSGGLAIGAASLSSAALAELFHLRGLKLRIGATDWNLRQEGKLEAIPLGKKIGFDGVQVSLGVGDSTLPLGDMPPQKHNPNLTNKNNPPIPPPP